MRNNLIVVIDTIITDKVVQANVYLLDSKCILTFREDQHCTFKHWYV